jgi:hypothetical protein
LYGGGARYYGARPYGGVYYRGGYGYGFRPGGYYGYAFCPSYSFFYFPTVHYVVPAPAPVVTFGLTIGNVAPENYYYWDPYTGQVVGSLDEYLDQCDQEDHPPVVEVISDGGEYVGSYEWDGDSWNRCQTPGH